MCLNLIEQNSSNREWILGFFGNLSTCVFHQVGLIMAGEPKSMGGKGSLDKEWSGTQGDVRSDRGSFRTCSHGFRSWVVINLSAYLDTLSLLLLLVKDLHLHGFFGRVSKLTSLRISILSHDPVEIFAQGYREDMTPSSTRSETTHVSHVFLFRILWSKRYLTYKYDFQIFLLMISPSLDPGLPQKPRQLMSMRTCSVKSSSSQTISNPKMRHTESSGSVRFNQHYIWCENMCLGGLVVGGWHWLDWVEGICEIWTGFLAVEWWAREFWQIPKSVMLSSFHDCSEVLVTDEIYWKIVF